MAARRLQSAGQVPAGIIRSTNNSSVSVRAPDLSDQGSGDFAAALDHRRKEEKRNHVHHHRR